LGELIFGGGVYVEGFVAAPAFADALGDGLGVTLGFGSGLGGFLFEVLRVLWGDAGGEKCEREGGKTEGAYTFHGFSVNWMNLQWEAVGCRFFSVAGDGVYRQQSVRVQTGRPALVVEIPGRACGARAGYAVLRLRSAGASLRSG